MKKEVAILAPLLVVMVGCGAPDTNVITPEAVESANKTRIQAIDNDPTMTPEGKAKMKQMLGLEPGKPRSMAPTTQTPTKR